MSAGALAQAWGARRGWSAATKLVALAVADVVNDMHGHRFWASCATIAAKTELADSTVRTCMAELVADGTLEVLERRPGYPTVYRWSLPASEPAPSPERGTAGNRRPPSDTPPIDTGDPAGDRRPPRRESATNTTNRSERETPARARETAAPERRPRWPIPEPRSHELRTVNPEPADYALALAGIRAAKSVLAGVRDRDLPGREHGRRVPALA